LLSARIFLAYRLIKQLKGALGWARWLEDVMSEKPKPPGGIKIEKEENGWDAAEASFGSSADTAEREGMQRLYWEFVRGEDQLDRQYWRPAKSSNQREDQGNSPISVQQLPVR